MLTLAHVGQLGGDVQGADIILGDLEVGLAVGQDGSAVQIGELVGNDNAFQLFQLEGLVAQSLIDLGVTLVTVVGVEDVVVDHVDQDSLEQDLGNSLTVGILTQSAGHDVLGDLAGLGGAGGLDFPVGTGEAAVGSVADGAQDHGQGGVAGDLGVGVELTAAHALDVLGVGAVVDVASEPGSAGDVGEEVVVSIDADLLVLHVAGDNAVDDGRSLSAGDGPLGLEGTVLVALEDAQALQDFDGRLVFFIDTGRIREVRGAGGSHEGQAHDEGQHHCENLLEISHGGFFLLLNFLERKALIFAINRKSYILFRQIGNYQAPYRKKEALKPLRRKGFRA